MSSLDEITKRVLELAACKPRIFVAIAGPPASGKSTLCADLEQKLLQRTSVAVVPMDGYHYDNGVLSQLGLLDRKGAPNTFDVAGLKIFLNALKNQTEPLAAPIFDRELDLSKNSARLIQPEDKVILVEGNYLLCNSDPWGDLQACFDLTVYLSVEDEVLERRLVERWLNHDHTAEQAMRRAKHNDLPNAEYTKYHTLGGDFILYD